MGLRILKKNPQKSTRTLSEELSASIDTINRQIKTLRKLYRSCRSISHELTLQQAKCRVNICRQLIGNPIYDRFIKKIIVTCGENASITATLTPRNSGSVPVNLQKSSLKKSVQPRSSVCLVEFWRYDSLGACSKQVCSRCGYLFSTTGTSSWNFETEITSIS